MIGLLQFAQRLTSSGLSVIAIKADGSKSPPFEWKKYQKHIAGAKDLEDWFGNGKKIGAAVVCGSGSGNLEIMDFDSPELVEPYLDLVKAQGAGELLETLPKVRTPSGGLHLYYRCDQVQENQKLAKRLIPALPQSRKKEKIKTLIETRGDGGYALIPGCPVECHPDRRPYQLIQGELTTIPRIMPAERALLLDCARAFNEYFHEKQPSSKGESHHGGIGDRPGDEFNQRGSWKDILEPARWILVYSKGQTAFWRRPDKKGPGISATTNHQGLGLLYVFSSNAHPFEPESGYSKFSAFALLNHAGDFAGAAKELAQKGFGKQAPKREPPPFPDDTRAPHQPGDDTEAGIEGRIEKIRPTKYSHDAIADQFSARYTQNLRYVDKWGWVDWTGQRWRRVSSVFVMDLARPICRSVAQLCKDDLDIPIVSTREGLARSIASAQTIAAVEKLARGDGRHYSEVEKWDADLWAFNTPGGTIDLRTGRLRPHRREDLITKISNATPRGDCPRWMAFLDRVTAVILSYRVTCSAWPAMHWLESLAKNASTSSMGRAGMAREPFWRLWNTSLENTRPSRGQRRSRSLRGISIPAISLNSPAPG